MFLSLLLRGGRFGGGIATFVREFHNVSSSEVASWRIQAARRGKMVPLLIDVREKEEYDELHLDGEDVAHVPLSEIIEQPEASTARLQALHSANRVVLFCRAGTRSMIACQLLESRNVFGDDVQLFNVSDGGIQTLKQRN